MNGTPAKRTHRSKRNKKINKERRQRRRQHRLFWDGLCVQYYLRIVAYAQTLANGDISIAHDLAQGTVLRVLKYSPDPNGISNPYSYLLRVAKNLWIDSRGPEEESLDDLMETDPDNPALAVPSDLAEILEHRDEFESKLGPISSELMTTLIMRLKGYSWDEIAAVLNEPVSRTKFRWYSFIKRLHERLSQSDE